jgi:hypothetical protein
MRKRYSIYDRKTGQPVYIYGTAEECAAAAGITLGSFRTYMSHTRTGARAGRYEVYEDGEDHGIDFEEDADDD